jgi:uncharacterized repeat protein (TIGR01451 family)
MVVLITNPCCEGSSGFGWLLESMYGNPDYAFSTVEKCCALLGIFGHELGHNMGAEHDWSASGETWRSYAHGFTDRQCKWKTIMAYGGGCYWMDPIEYFSNPNVTVSGRPTGLPEGTGNNCTGQDLAHCDADVARLFNETGIVVANYRVNTANISPVFDAVELTSDPETITRDTSIITYSLTLRNIGSVTATGIILKNEIPASTSFISADNGGVYASTGSGTFTGDTITWSGLTLAPGTSLTVMFSVSNASGTFYNHTALTNTVSGSSAEGVDIPLTTFTTLIVSHRIYLPAIFK